MIVVEGNLRTSSYDDKKYPDVKHYVTEVYTDQVYFGGDKSDKQQQTTQPAQTVQPTQNNTVTLGDFGDFEEVIGGDDLPF